MPHDPEWSDYEREHDFANARGLSDETLRRFGVYFAPGAVVFPVRTADGQERGRRGRYLSEHPKYGPFPFVEGTPGHLFNVQALVQSWRVYVCEGEIDTLTLEQLGLSAVGVPGTQGFKSEWRFLFCGHDVRICFDGDPAGRTAAARLQKLLLPLADEVSILRFPDGEDVNSLYTRDYGELRKVLFGDHRS